MKRRLPVGIPCDYSELLKIYRSDLKETSKGLGVTLEELLDAAREAQVIENFRIEEHCPATFSWDEACAFVGMTGDHWHELLVKMKRPPKGSRIDWASVRPEVVRGYNGKADQGPAEPYDGDAVYWGPDILRVAEFLDDNNLPRGLSSCPAMVESFLVVLHEFFETTHRRKVKEASQRLGSNMADLESDCKAPWPKDLPQNDREMVTLYNDYVFDQVRRISKIKTEAELEEVTQQVWFNLIQSEVLAKFVEAAKTKLPRTLTTSEVLGYLGVTPRQWASAVAFSQKSDDFWLPLPIKGLHLAEDALYLTEDIQTLDTSGFLEHSRNAPRQHPEFSGRGFKSYLSKAVGNHFKNLLRTRSRRHKERAVEANVVLTTSSSGTYHRAYTAEETTSWEENLMDGGDLEMEDMLDLKAMLERHSVNPLTDTGRAVLDHISQGLTVKGAVKYEQRQASIRQKQLLRATA
jgi:hypothetical protein